MTSEQTTVISNDTKKKHPWLPKLFAFLIYLLMNRRIGAAIIQQCILFEQISVSIMIISYFYGWMISD